jgi:SAM-dependent methyltransferase
MFAEQIHEALSSLDASALSAVAKTLYKDGPLFRRKLQHWRPHICPFESLFRHVPQGSKVLDIGCGGGLFLNLMAGVGMEFVGVGFDVSQPAIDMANAAAKQVAMSNSKATLSFHRIDLGRDWPAGKFDVLTCIDVLHHVPAASQRDFVRRLASATCAKKLIFKDVSPVPLWMGLASFLHDLALSRQWITMRHEDRIREWLIEEGLTVTECRRLDTLWYSHYLIVGEK